MDFFLIFDKDKSNFLDKDEIKMGLRVKVKRLVIYIFVS